MSPYWLCYKLWIVPFPSLSAHSGRKVKNECATQPHQGSDGQNTTVYSLEEGGRERIWALSNHFMGGFKNPLARCQREPAINFFLQQNLSFQFVNNYIASSKWNPVNCSKTPKPCQFHVATQESYDQRQALEIFSRKDYPKYWRLKERNSAIPSSRQPAFITIDLSIFTAARRLWRRAKRQKSPLHLASVHVKEFHICLTELARG